MAVVWNLEPSAAAGLGIKPLAVGDEGFWMEPAAFCKFFDEKKKETKMHF